MIHKPTSRLNFNSLKPESKFNDLQGMHRFCLAVKTTKPQKIKFYNKKSNRSGANLITFTMNYHYSLILQKNNRSQ